MYKFGKKTPEKLQQFNPSSDLSRGTKYDRHDDSDDIHEKPTTVSHNTKKRGNSLLLLEMD